MSVTCLFDWELGDCEIVIGGNAREKEVNFVSGKSEDNSF